MLRQQQDEAYLASLRADQEKERKKREERERRRRKEEEVQQQKLAEERRRQVSQASVPHVPSILGTPGLVTQSSACEGRALLGLWVKLFLYLFINSWYQC